MRIGLAAILVLTIPSAIDAQMTKVEQKAIMDRAIELHDISQRFVEAEKEGNQASISAIALPNASFLDESWNSTPLNSSSITKLAKNCSPIYGTDPEIISGRVSLPRDKQSIFWQCPQAVAASPVKTIIEYSGDKIAFVRDIAGLSAPIVVAPR